MRAEGCRVAPPHSNVVATRCWLELSEAPQHWLVSGKLLSEPVFDHDGARYYGDDLLTLVLEHEAVAPAPAAHLVALYTKPVIALELYAGAVGKDWVDKGILLRPADGAALLLSVETSTITLSCGETAIAEVIDGWANDWPEIQRRHSLVGRPP